MDGQGPVRLRRRLPLLVVCAIIAASATSAQSEVDGAGADAPEIDLTVREVIVLTLRNSRMLENARLNRSVDRFALLVAEDEFRPRLTLDAYADRDAREVVDETSGIGSSVRLRVPTGGEFALSSRVADAGIGALTLASHSSVIELTFTQPLLRGAGFGVARGALQTARVTEEINALAFESAVIDLISRAVRAYRAYVQAGQRDEIAVRSLDRARRLLEVNRLLVQSGRMAERDVIQAEADIARRELDVVAARGNLDAARLNLLDLLDLETRTRFGEAEGLAAEADATEPLNIESAFEIALANRPDYAIGLLEVRNAETRAHLARNAQLWDLSLTLGRAFTGSDDGFGGAIRDLDRSRNRVSLDLNVPVGRAAAGRARLEHRRAVAGLQAARNRLDDLRQRIAIDVQNAVREIGLAERRLELASRARELAQQKTEIEREKLNLGITTNFQLVAFENDLVLAENAELDAAVGKLNAATELDRTLGTTLERWGIEIDRVEHDNAEGERFGLYRETVR